MLIEGIDYSKCIDCGKCVKVCPSSLYSETDGEYKYSFNDPYKHCVRCGHCIAICPPEAILYEDAEKPFDFEGTKKLSEIISYDDLMKSIRLRRSMRVFKDKAVPKEKIKKLLEAMRYAPSAGNRQNWRYTVITNKEEIKFLSKQTSKFFKMARRLLPFKYLIMPFLTKGVRRRVLNPKTKTQLDNSLKRMEQGEDIIFFNAPCVIVLYARKYTNNLAANDAGIALTHGMFAAQSLDLGTCWIGFAQRRIQNIRKLKKHFGVPKGFHVFGVLTVGIPAIEYQRGPPRRELRVTWYE